MHLKCFDNESSSEVFHTDICYCRSGAEQSEVNGLGMGFGCCRVKHYKLLVYVLNYLERLVLVLSAIKHC